MKRTSLALILFSQLSLANSYTVPAPAELASEATWNNVTAEAHIANNELSIKYLLPSDLVGTVSNEFNATGPVGNSSFIPVSGERVFGTCMRSLDKPLVCVLKYPRSIVDTATRDLALREHFDGAQFETKSAIARLFGADPAGLLSVEIQ